LPAALRSLCLWLLVCSAQPAVAAAALPLCPWDPTDSASLSTVVDVDKVWSGARVDFAGAVDGKQLVVGYYDQERWLTVAWYGADGQPVRRQRLPNQFAGWDSHNAIALAVDRFGLVHVAANMHASALNYFRSTTPDGQLAPTRMTDSDSDLVTYPQFVTTRAGDLLFFYRAGRSGDGAWKVNRWDGTRWTRLNDGRPFLGDRGFGRSVSGYPSRFVMAADGYFHLAIVWRLTTDAATNVRLSYAKTKDFVSWFDSRNKPLAFPVSAETAETVLHTGPGKGLLNNAKVSLDPQGRPVIVFTRQDATGRNTVELAIADQGQWRTILLNTAERGVDVKGTGSLPNTVALTDIDFSHEGRPSLYHRFPGAAGVREALDPATLLPRCTEKPAPEAMTALADRPLPTARPQVLAIDRNATLVWSAQPANQDQPRACTDETPLACRPPPSTLKLVITRREATP